MTKQLRPQQSQLKVNSDPEVTKKRWLLIVSVCILLAVASIVYILGSLGTLPGAWGNALAALFVILSTVPPVVERLLPKKSEQAVPSPAAHPIASASPPLPTTLSTSSLASSQAVSLSSSIAHPPFLVNMPLPDPNEFYGRERERTKLIERTSCGVCTSLVGPRRIGKTWILTYLRHVASSHLQNGFRMGYIDASLPSCATVSGFTTEVLRTLGLLHLASSSQPSLALLEEIVKGMSAKREILVLCIDEFEGLTNHPHEFNLAFFTGLRALTQVGLCLVTASKVPLIDLVSGNTKTSPFFNIFFQVKLGFFDRYEAERFVHAKGGKVQFTNEEQEIMLRYGKNGKLMLWPPLKLQLVGELLLEEKRLATDGRTYTSLPGNPRYWQKFRQRLDETYQGMVKS